MDFDQQLGLLSCAFAKWNAEEKKIFFSQLLEYVIPGRLFVLAECMNTMNIQQSEAFTAELHAVLAFVDAWSNAERNLMIDHLETLDSQYVREFDEMIAKSAGQA